MNDHHKHKKNEIKTLWVVILTAVTMGIEIAAGLMTNSMALLADGIHMGSHVLAIGLSLIAYIIVRKMAASRKYNAAEEKILSLSGFTSGLSLLIFAIIILIEAIQRFTKPLAIEYHEAIIIASIGLVVNIISAFLLHNKHEHSDHNIRAAYIHVLADTLTSVSAIIGLLVALYWDIAYIDTLAAIISSIVIIKWSVGLLKDSGAVLLDFEVT